MNDKVVTFVDFKVDVSGDIRFGVIKVTSRTLDGPIEGFSSNPFRRRNKDWTESDIKEWLLKISKRVYKLLDGNICVGHGISGDSGVIEYFKKFELSPPEPSCVLDTRVLLSGTKLAEIAEFLGLGSDKRDAYDNCVHKIDAAKRCVDVLLIYEPDRIENCMDGPLHPMITYLMCLKTQTTEAAKTEAQAHLTVHLNELDIGR